MYTLNIKESKVQRFVIKEPAKSVHIPRISKNSKIKIEIDSSTDGVYQVMPFLSVDQIFTLLSNSSTGYIPRNPLQELNMDSYLGFNLPLSFNGSLPLSDDDKLILTVENVPVTSFGEQDTIPDVTLTLEDHHIVGSPYKVTTYDFDAHKTELEIDFSPYDSFMTTKPLKAVSYRTLYNGSYRNIHIPKLVSDRFVRTIRNNVVVTERGARILKHHVPYSFYPVFYSSVLTLHKEAGEKYIIHALTT